jgi:hypothetical protein
VSTGAVTLIAVFCVIALNQVVRLWRWLRGNVEEGREPVGYYQEWVEYHNVAEIEVDGDYVIEEERP